MPIPRQSVNLSGAEFRAIFRTISSGHMQDGLARKEFEARFARYIGVKYAVAVSSGRAAQYLALKALNLDAGSEVLVPAYTFYIVPVIVRSLGLTPVFVDADEQTYNIDVAQIEAKITARTRCIIATHIAGQPCDMEAIRDIARRHRLYVIEDCAEACGAEYKGHKVGSIGDIGYFSFHVSKNMTCLGGGMITGNDDELFKKIAALVGGYKTLPVSVIWKNLVYSLFTYLFTRTWVFSVTAYPLIVASHVFRSSRIDQMFIEKITQERVVSIPAVYLLSNIQAVVGLVQLARLDSMNVQRRKNAEAFANALGMCGPVAMQKTLPDTQNTFLYLYLKVADRDQIRKQLAFLGIDSKDDALSNCPALPFFHDKGQYPASENLVSVNIELPNYPTLKEHDMIVVAEEIKKVMSSAIAMSKSAHL